MKKQQFILTAFMLLASVSMSAQDDFGIWGSVGAEKKISKKFSVGAEAEFRTRDNTSEIDRWSIGVDAKYKLADWLKVGAGYDFLDYHNAEHTKYKANGTAKWTRSQWWGTRHRLHADITGSLGLGNWEISLRERWQYTYRNEKTGISRYDYSDEEWETDDVRGKGKNVLKSRLQLEYDIPGSPVKPYGSVELSNAWSVEKVRYTVGADWKITKKHNLGLYYRYQTTTDEDETNRHIVGVGYKFKF